MLLSTYCRQLQSHRPRSFLGLMELYEENYIRLRRLCPDIRVRRGAAVSVVAGALDLHLDVLEQTSYTTTVRLTYILTELAHQPVPDPDLKLRVYHDARQAEVLSRACRRRGVELSVRDLTGRSELLCRWKLNRFLYKWLGYCCHQRHHFTPDEGAGKLRPAGSVARRGS